MLAARREGGLGLVIVRLEDHDPRSLWKPVPEALSLARHALGLVGLEPAGEHLLDQVAAEPALDLRRRPLLRKLDGEHRGAMLQRAEPPLGVHRLVTDADDQQGQRLCARAHRDHVQGSGGPPSCHSKLARRCTQRGHMDPLRHAIGRFARTAHAVAVRRVERGATAGQGADHLEDGGDAGAVQRQLREALVDVVRQANLRQLDLGPALQLAALQDAGDLGRDRAEEVDVGGAELASLRALHVEDPHEAWSRLDRHRGHGVKAILVEAGNPLPVRLLAHVGDHRRMS